MNQAENVARFESEWAAVQRPGADAMLNYFRKSDFYTAPASTRFHLSCEGGLLQHSLNVLDCLRDALRYDRDSKRWEYWVCGKCVDSITDESAVVIALCHDLCKTNFYTTSLRNQKNDQTGRWEKVPYYSVDDKMPMGGHGWKSAFLAMKFMPLESVEVYAVRYHMGFSDIGDAAGDLRNAIEAHPIIWAVHDADMRASTLLEDRTGNKDGFQSGWGRRGASPEMPQPPSARYASADEPLPPPPENIRYDPESGRVMAATDEEFQPGTYQEAVPLQEAMPL